MSVKKTKYLNGMQYLFLGIYSSSRVERPNGYQFFPGKDPESWDSLPEWIFNITTFRAIPQNHITWFRYSIYPE